MRTGWLQLSGRRSRWVMAMPTANSPVGPSTPALALSGREHRRLADVLLLAARNRTPVDPLSRRYPELTAADAAKIRDLTIARRLADGERLIGAKPELGWLTDRMLKPGPQLDLGDLIHPLVEPKLALQLHSPLRRPVSSLAGLLANTERVLPCIEILDPRCGTAALTGVDATADNGAAARLVIGAGAAPPSASGLRAVELEFELRTPSRESGSPLHARSAPSPAPLVRLAEALIQERKDLGNRALLLTPGWAQPTVLPEGAFVRAHFTGIGAVELMAAGHAGDRHCQ